MDTSWEAPSTVPSTESCIEQLLSHEDEEILVADKAGKELGGEGWVHGKGRERTGAESWHITCVYRHPNHGLDNRWEALKALGVGIDFKNIVLKLAGDIPCIFLRVEDAKELVLS